MQSDINEEHEPQSIFEYKLNYTYLSMSKIWMCGLKNIQQNEAWNKKQFIY